MDVCSESYIPGAKRVLVLTTISAVANFAAYTFAPPILVTPLGALSVLIG